MGNMKSSYIEKVKTSFPIENRYRTYGMYASSDIKFEKVGIDRVKSIKIYYPNEMILFPGKKYPLVIMVNGTGVEYPKYEPTLKHLSSWGFIVAGNDDPSTATGDSAVKTLEYILNLNNSKDSIFCNKIDVEKIGLSGHSQGGCGVFNAITKHGELSKHFKCAFASSGPTKSLIEKFKLEPFKYQPELVNIPIMMTISNGPGDKAICPYNETKENYDKIGKNIKKVLGVRKGVDHGNMLVAHDPYMTAWFCYILLNDLEASKAFCGNDAEFLKNNNWENCEIKNL